MSERSVQRVAVGLTHEHAASVFGMDHDDVLVTTFADFADDVDLDALHQVDVAASDDLPAILEALLPRTADGTLRVRVEYAPKVRELLARALEARPQIGVASVDRVGGRVMVTLAHLEPAEARASWVALGALRASVPVESAPVEPAAVVPAAETTSPARVAARVRRTPEPGNPAPTSRRRALIAAGGLGAVAAGGAAAVVLVADDVTWSLTLVLASTVVVVVWIAVVLMLLQRDLRTHRTSVESMVRRQRGVIRRRTEAIVREQRALRIEQRELPALVRHVEAVDIALSTLRAELREWMRDADRPDV